MIVIYGGSSITNAIDGFRTMSSNWLAFTHRSIPFTVYNASQSSRNSWNNLMRIQSDYLDRLPDLIVFDNANNDAAGIDRQSIEALIRRVWAAFPDCKFVFMKIFSVTNPYVDAGIDSPTNATQQAEFSALAAQYGIPLVLYYDSIKTMVNGGDRLFRYMVDTIHPNPDGHCIASTLLESYLTLSFLSTRQSPAVLPARLYDNGDYENTATIKNGTAYDSLTGSWTPAGTSISSSSAGATITYSATCQSYGRPETDGTMQVSIDGGAYVTVVFGPNGLSAGARAAHTITIKVVSGTVTISKFWAL